MDSFDSHCRSLEKAEFAGVDNARVVKSAVAATATRRCYRQYSRRFTGIIISWCSVQNSCCAMYFDSGLTSRPLDQLDWRKSDGARNNVLESFHASIQRRKKVAHPNLYAFLGHLQRVTVDNQADTNQSIIFRWHK